MKIQHYAIIFIIIILPFSIICKSLINDKIDALNTETRINNALDTATTDAIDTFIDLNDVYYSLYDGQTIDVTPGIAREGIKVFFESLSVNYGLPFVEDEEFAESYFSTYVPAIIVVAYDGFYIYSVENSGGTYEYVLSPKIPYAYQSGDYYINFTLGNYIRLYTPKGILYEGEFKHDYIDDADVVSEYNELSGILSSSELLEFLPQLTTDMSLIAYALEENSPNSLPEFLRTKSSSGKPSMLSDYDAETSSDEVSDFHKLRRETIINLIISTLNEKINNHNRYADIMGVTYDFYLPDIPASDWINAVDDISIMAFVQGIPTGSKSYYNSYALGASRIIRKNYVYGTTDGLYHEESCATLAGEFDEYGYPVSGGTIDNMFLNNIDAAKEGYYPCMKCKP